MNVPGPSKYNILKPFGSDSNKFSIIPRREDTSMKSRSKEPGPGDYKIVGINTKGVYPLSNYKNTPSINFSNYSSKRFDYSVKDKSPGPSKYIIKPLINSTGKIYESNFRSSGSPMIIGRKKDLTSRYTNRESKFINK